MFMFTELEGRVEKDGGVRKSAGEREKKRERDSMLYEEIIREVRLGRIKRQGKKIGRNVEKR